MQANTKKISLSYFLLLNLCVVLMVPVSSTLLNISNPIGVVFVLYLILSLFQTYFFYRASNRSFQPIPQDKFFIVLFSSLGATAVSVLSVVVIYMMLT